ncbi:hypothetical protein NDU88_005845 [Pleurodeles waltl]|uniref:Uncharacterized protein n=1 Tax=Pleurodeles waltl TaxID=8319 RepID=A0AAV7MB75_PLEWA|nr:hypothetical protein NDU88_005845 [Pleurodeles waltl]
MDLLGADQLRASPHPTKLDVSNPVVCPPPSAVTSQGPFPAAPLRCVLEPRSDHPQVLVQCATVSMCALCRTSPAGGRVVSEVTWRQAGSLSLSLSPHQSPGGGGAEVGAPNTAAGAAHVTTKKKEGRIGGQSGRRHTNGRERGLCPSPRSLNEPVAANNAL